MPIICDICGAQLTPAEKRTIFSNPVVTATSNGYVPSKLPSDWKPQCEMLGITIASHWAAVVKMNSEVNWVLCKSCHEEVAWFNADHGGHGLIDLNTQDGVLDYMQRSTLIIKNASLKNVTARLWFMEASNRGGPHMPSDFNLFELPRSSVEEWASSVSAEPVQVRCTEVRISELGRVTQTLFDAIKKQHQLDSRSAVKIFDEYLGAACPKCFGGITGSMLQMVAAGSQMASVIGGGAGFQRILSGRCGTCESEAYFIVWHGDARQPIIKGSTKPQSKKWWKFWTI